MSTELTNISSSFTDRAKGHCGMILSIVVVFILFSIAFIPIGVTGEAGTQSSGVGLVVGEEGMIISGPEYVVRGTILIESRGELEIRDTTLEIFQESPEQDLAIKMEEDARLTIRDSNIIAEGDLDISMSGSSKLEIIGSEIELAGDIHGSVEEFTTEESEFNLDLVELSSSEFEAKRSIFHSEISLDSDSRAEMYGSSFEDLEVNHRSEAEIYEKISIYVRDRIGVPVGGAEVAIERKGEDDWINRTESERDGVVERYLLSEIVLPDESKYTGNYEIRLEGYERFYGTNVSLPPLERRTPDRDLEELPVRTDIELGEADLETTYYDELDHFNDLYLDNETKVMDTYPDRAEGSFINHGNVYLSNESEMVLGNHTRLNIPQEENRYRIELKNDSKLRMQKNSSIISDRPLNIYLRDNSTLILEETELDIGSIYSEDSAKFAIDDSNINSDLIYIDTEIFEMKNSMIYSNSFTVEADERIILKDSEINTGKNVSLEADYFDLVDLKFTEPVYFERRIADEFTLTNVTSPEIIPVGDLTINREWYLTVEIFNGEDRYVPLISDIEEDRLNISRKMFQRGSLEKEYVMDIQEVEKGRIEVPLKSESIRSDRTEFTGNYVVEASKRMNDEIIKSETTMVGLEGNTKTEVRFLDEFPYLMKVDVEMPTTVEAGESFEIEGRAVYDDMDIDVEYARVEVEIEDKGEQYRWSTTTDDNGDFILEVDAPTTLSTYDVVIKVHDEEMMMEAEETVLLEVDGETESALQHIFFETTFGRILTVVIIIILTFLAYRILDKLLKEEEFPLSRSNKKIDFNKITNRR